MGVPGLPKEIADTGGPIPDDIKNKLVHIDMYGAYYRLIKARCFSVVEKFTSSNARTAAINHQHSGTPMEVDPSLVLDQQLFERANQNPSLAGKLAQLTHDASRSLSVAVTKAGQVADPANSKRSMQEHQKRQTRQYKAMDSLRTTAIQARVVGGSRRKAVYKKARDLYRPPLGIVGEIIAELALTYGCHVCFCAFQSDTCIARHCASVKNPEDVYVVSGDSDLICYKAVPSLTYLLGKRRTMTVIRKPDLLKTLDLPSDNHLLLAAVVAGSDYTNEVPYYGLTRSIDIIRTMNLPSIDVDSFRRYVHEFLSRVHQELLGKRWSRKKRSTLDAQLAVGPDDFDHAIRAFVEMSEDMEPGANTKALGDVEADSIQIELDRGPGADLEQGSGSDTLMATMDLDHAIPLEPLSAALTQDACHDLVVEVLYHLEFDKTMRDVATSLSQHTPAPNIDYPNRRHHRRKRTSKGEQRKKNSHKYRKRKHWRRSKFRSRWDLHPRYTAHLVENPSTASPVDESELSKMMPSPPRRSLTSNNTTSNLPASGSSSFAASSSSPFSTPSSANKKKKKSKSKGSAKTRNVDAIPTAALLKDVFKASFKTVTQTVGSVKACVRRGLGSRGATDPEVDIIATRLESAAHVISDTRVHVFRMLTMLTLSELTHQHADDGDSQSVDPLDLLLKKSAGTLLIRNLATLVLNGKLDRKTSKEENGIAARDLAMRTYDRYKEMAIELRPLNNTSISVGDNVMELSLSVFVAWQQHSKRLPLTIMKSLGWESDTIPGVPGQDETERSDDPSLDQKQDDGLDEDGCLVFTTGHVRAWWHHLLSLPTHQRPVFTPHPSLKPVFIQMQKRAVRGILWKKKDNPAYSIVTRFLSAADAELLVKVRPGELLQLLIYGRRGAGNRVGIRTKMSSYDKHSTKMAALAELDPQQYGYRALQGYVNERITHNKAVAAARDHVPGVTNDEAITGEVWARRQDPADATVHLPSVADMESSLPANEHYAVEEFEDALLVRLSLESMLQEIHSMSRLQKDCWAEKHAKRAELDMAVDAVLKMCGSEPCLIGIGNGKFRTGLNLASKHESFQTYFAKKARALGHVVVLVVEYLSSTMCPSYAAHDVTSRVAKLTSRSCVFTPRPLNDPVPHHLNLHNYNDHEMVVKSIPIIVTSYS
ncbi:hypothetical protein BG015_008048 [Linnemannia schmuckeri]|uniref:Uncharacterized protein n=1 Tax=Linnemannia schmuckeri TaxID=64567 RepID=A0A9P5VAZ3_9FUNG|nr:hypothetical protein BG015_008048 [Linnemannia schmuckeri]